jgi:hypothetical protein
VRRAWTSSLSLTRTSNTSEHGPIHTSFIAFAVVDHAAERSARFDGLELYVFGDE